VVVEPTQGLRGGGEPPGGRLPDLSALDIRRSRARLRASSTGSPRRADCRGGGRPYLSRAFFGRRGRGRAQRRAPRLPVQESPRDPGLAALETGERLLVTGPLGRGFSMPGDSAPGRGGAILVGAASASRRSRSSAGARARRVPTESCSASATSSTTAAPISSTARRCGSRRGRLPGYEGPGHRSARGSPRGRLGRDRRRLRLRPPAMPRSRASHVRPSAASPPS